MEFPRCPLVACRTHSVRRPPRCYYRCMEASQQNPRSWQEMRQWQVELLERTTGQSLEAWNELVRRDGPAAEKELRAWLAEHSVTGYSQMLLVFERFGYPDFFTRSADELVQGQYADRPQLREIYDAVLALLLQLGGKWPSRRARPTSPCSPPAAPSRSSRR